MGNSIEAKAMALNSIIGGPRLAIAGDSLPPREPDSAAVRTRTFRHPGI
jgi:hypothetical protein